MLETSPGAEEGRDMSRKAEFTENGRANSLYKVILCSSLSPGSRGLVLEQVCRSRVSAVWLWDGCDHRATEMGTG